MVQRLRERILAADPLARDALLAGALAIAGLLELAARGALVPGEIGLALLMTVPLAWRRRSPLVSTALVMGAVAAAQRPPTELHLILAATLTAMFSLGTFAYGRAAIAGLAFALGALGTSIALSSVKSPSDLLRDAVSVATVITVPFAVGRVLRGRELRLVASQERIRRLELEREAKAHRAVSDERARIARELHDVVAHGVSVMVVQAGAAAEVLARDPEAARGALVAIQDTGRQALADLRRMLGLVREGDPLALAPRPGLEQLGPLLDQVRTAGVPIDVEVHGTPRELPAGVDVSAYRIVQEALTNVLKHAGPARAHVIVAYGPEAVDLEVVDDGRGPQEGQGHGLVGMRERVALYGGTLEAGPAQPRGFRVHARLPVA
jgi:signal transduction histidine kinase